MGSVWVTGAATGIGAAMATAFADEGYDVTLTGRRRAPLEETAQSIAATGGTAHVAPADVMDRAALGAIVQGIVDRTGALDIVCNNAGINIERRHWAEIDWPAWDAVLDINVKGALNVIAVSLPPMRAQGSGLLINTASWAGRFYSAVAGVAYGASKHALMSINASLNAEEGKHGIRATALCPAEVDTPLLANRPNFDQAVAAAAIRPEDMAEAALYVARASPNVAVHEIVIAPVRR